MGALSKIGGAVKKIAKQVPVLGQIVEAVDGDAGGQKITPGTDAMADKIRADADATAARAKELADKAMGRDSTGAVQGQPASTAAPVTVGTVDNVNAGPIDKAGRTEAPTIGPVRDTNPAKVGTPTSVSGLGSNVGGVNDSNSAQAAAVTADQGGRQLQNTAAAYMQSVLAGGETPAQLQLKAAQDRAAAEQLSIAAGARGQGIVAARRAAANNISGQQMAAGGQMAELKAKELADAASGLAQTGSAIQGQSIDVAKTQASLTQEADIRNAESRDKAIQASRDRFARGEITKAQLEADIAKANAEFEQRTSEKRTDTDTTLAIERSRQQLQADLASDGRLQEVLTREAELRQQAAQGNQNAQVELTKLQATIDSEIRRFNAQQIQTADQNNIENRLKAMQLDDAYVANMVNAWIQAETSGDQTAINALKLQINRDTAAAEADEKWKQGFRDDAMSVIKAIGISDVRAKQGIRSVSPESVDDFLRTVGKTYTWEYKDPGRHGAGRHIGPMAQQIAGSAAGKEAVGQSEDGLMNLDYQKLAALAMAGVGRLNERLEAVEGGGKKRKPDVDGFLRANGGVAS